MCSYHKKNTVNIDLSIEVSYLYILYFDFDLVAKVTFP